MFQKYLNLILVDISHARPSRDTHHNKALLYQTPNSLLETN